MNKILILSIVLLLLIIDSHEKQLSCLTGLKILTRRQVTDYETKQISYKFQHRCLCPNNYYGKECQNHISIDCYLTDNHNKQHKQPLTIDESNIKQDMDLQMDFLLDCWVGQRSRFRSKIKLVDYLQQFNQQNAYGVRQQFGDGIDIIWANTTQNIFDQKGQFKIISQMTSQNQSYQLTQEQKLKILIGNNTELYTNPFTYQSDFLGYGLINGNVNYQLRLQHPQKGMISLSNYTNKDIKVIQNKQTSSPSRRVTLQQQSTDQGSKQDKSKTLIKDIESKISTSKIDQSSLKQYADDYSKIYDLFNDKTLTQSNKLYQIRLPIKVNPYNSTFYSAIKLSLIISQTYQQIITHQISLNSYDQSISVNVPNIGYQPNLYKNLIIASQSYRTYYKIILVVGIVLILYFALTFGYKKWKIHKQKALQQSQYQISLQQQVIKTSK